MIPETTLFEPKAIFELTNYTLKTWNLDKKHTVDVVCHLNDILMKCAEEYRKRPDRIGKEAYKKLEKALKLIDQADGLLLDPYSISYKDAPFSEIMSNDYKSLNNIGTVSEDLKLKNVQLSNAKNRITLLSWLGQNKPTSIPKSHKRREIITIELYKMYQGLTAQKHVKRNKPGQEGTRIHTPFSKVAILIDRLVGNPHYDIECIDIWKNGNLNINDIVDCSETTTSTFCQSLEKYLPK